MSSSLGCWSISGEVLAREYSDQAYFDIHRLAIDAYAVQHPGLRCRQGIQSVGVHLVRLCLFLEHGLTADKANDAILEAGENKHSFFFLEPPKSFGSITAADIYRADSVAKHKTMVRDWAQCA